jgi:hypothetical protein
MRPLPPSLVRTRKVASERLEWIQRSHPRSERWRITDVKPRPARSRMSSAEEVAGAGLTKASAGAELAELLAGAWLSEGAPGSVLLDGPPSGSASLAAIGGGRVVGAGSPNMSFAAN